MNFETVIEKLRNNEPFHLSRWGDGEFLCMLGKEGKNCDGHDYTPILSEELNRVWADIEECEPNQFHLVQPHALRTVEGIESFINGKHFDSSDLFVKASQKCELGKLFAALKDKYLILVAPKRFEDWELFQVSKHIVIPDKNCFSLYEDCIKHIEYAHQLSYKQDKKQVTLYCSGMMTNVLISEQPTDETHIDLGSVLEPYIGHSNRKYHTEIIEKLKI